MIASFLTAMAVGIAIILFSALVRQTMRVERLKLALASAERKLAALPACIPSDVMRSSNDNARQFKRTYEVYRLGDLEPRIVEIDANGDEVR